MASSLVDGDLTVNGILAVRTLPAIARLNLTQESYSNFEVPFVSMRVWDDYKTPIATAGTSDDDLGFNQGVFGTGTPYISAGDLGTVGAKTRYARFLYQVPMNYVAGQAARFGFLAGIGGTTPQAASSSCTLDFEAFLVGTGNLVSGIDLVSSSATNINFTTFLSAAMDLNVTTLNPGDWLDCRITIACSDASAAAANCRPSIQKAQFQAMTRG